MEEVRSILSLQESASQKELEDKLKSLKVDELQLLCKETGVKRSGRHLPKPKHLSHLFILCGKNYTSASNFRCRTVRWPTST